MFKFAMFCHVDNFDLKKVFIFGLIQISECSFNWFIIEPVHEPKFYICHLLGLRGAYPKHQFFLDPYVPWFPIDLKICMTLKRSITQTSLVGAPILDQDPIGIP